MNSRALGYRETLALLRRLGDTAERLILVGGQAVNFWAEMYRTRVPDLQDGPYTSKDIDFYGLRQDARDCAARLGGRLQIPAMDDTAAATMSGLVRYRDADGEERILDILSSVHGLETKRVRDTAVPAEVREKNDDETTAVRFLVMHPVLSLFSRVHNTATWTTYRTERALRQLRASVLCAREFLRDLAVDTEVEQRQRVRAVLHHYEDVFRMCCEVRGRQLHHYWGIDLFAVVLPLAALPDKFRSVRHPQMLGELRRIREEAPPRPRGPLHVEL